MVLNCFRLKANPGLFADGYCLCKPFFKHARFSKNFNLFIDIKIDGLLNTLRNFLDYLSP